MEQNPVIWLVIPCYNEEQVLPKTAPQFESIIQTLINEKEIAPLSKVLFVNDGSKDTTWEIICKLSEKSSIIEGISLSRNRGHQNALLAGLMEAQHKCDATISIDCDGQDDISKITDMIQCYKEGYEVVYGVRNSRDTDTFFKRFSAESFYKLLNALGANVVYNHADYRLMGSKALAGLQEFHEVNLFLRGMVPLVGYPSTTVEYKREERIAGESHYPLTKMLHLAFDGITSLSEKPIHFITGAGLLFSLLGFIGIIWALINVAVQHAVAGWASIICIICFFGGVQLIALGIIGEYIGKIYLEVKHRPRFIVAQRTWNDN